MYSICLHAVMQFCRFICEQKMQQYVITECDISVSKLFGYRHTPYKTYDHNGYCWFLRKVSYSLLSLIVIKKRNMATEAIVASHVTKESTTFDSRWYELLKYGCRISVDVWCRCLIYLFFSLNDGTQAKKKKHGHSCLQSTNGCTLPLTSTAWKTNGLLW